MMKVAMANCAIVGKSGMKVKGSPLSGTAAHIERMVRARYPFRALVQFGVPAKSQHFMRNVFSARRDLPG
jgi:hypothetical protein